MPSTKLICAAFTLSVSAIIAQPANDQLCNATGLIVNASCSNGTNTGSAKTGEGSLPQPSCWSGTAYNESVWYSFVANNDSLILDIQAGTLANVLMSVYSSSNSQCSGTFTLIGCSQNSTDIELYGLTSGATYFIMIDGSANTDGTFCIRVHEPFNSATIGSCARPRQLYPAADCNNNENSQYENQNNIISTGIISDEGASMIGMGNSSGLDGATTALVNCIDNDAVQNAYWVKFTATASTQTFTNAGLGMLDYAIYTGSCGNFTPVTCRSIGPALSANITGLTPGTTYHVMITAGTANLFNMAYLCITSPTQYQNPYDNCASALSVSANATYTLNTSNATDDLALCSGQMDNNIWVTWTCPETWIGPAYVHLYDQDCACPNGSQLSIFSSSSSCPTIASTCEITLNPNNDDNFYGTFVPTPGNTYYITIDGYAGCACTMKFTIAGSELFILPLDLLYFDVTQERGMQAKISWSSASEKDVAYYNIERSGNAQDFEVIAQVQAHNEAGQNKGYIISDNAPLEGNSYYRLVQVKSTGEKVYSSVLLFNLKNEGEEFIAYPNPATDIINIKTSEKIQDGLIQFYDTFGTCVFTSAFQSMAEETITLNLRHLKDGIYFIVINDGEKVLKSRFTKLVQ